MKTIQSAEAKTHFSMLINEVKAGNEISILYGKKKQAIAVLVPYEKWKKTKKRKLGTLQGKVKVEFSSDFSMSDEELLNS